MVRLLSRWAGPALLVVRVAMTCQANKEHCCGQQPPPHLPTVTSAAAGPPAMDTSSVAGQCSQAGLALPRSTVASAQIVSPFWCTQDIFKKNGQSKNDAEFASGSACMGTRNSISQLPALRTPDSAHRQPRGITRRHTGHDLQVVVPRAAAKNRLRCACAPCSTSVSLFGCRCCWSM